MRLFYARGSAHSRRTSWLRWGHYDPADWFGLYVKYDMHDAESGQSPPLSLQIVCWRLNARASVWAPWLSFLFSDREWMHPFFWGVRYVRARGLLVMCGYWGMWARIERRRKPAPYAAFVTKREDVA